MGGGKKRWKGLIRSRWEDICNEKNDLLRGVTNLVAYYNLNAFAIWPDKRGFSYKGLLYANQKISFRLITLLPLF
jgi:hypothetical protein